MRFSQPDQRDQRDEPGGRDRGDRGRAAEQETPVLHDLLALPEGGGEIRGRQHDVRIDVPDDEQRRR